MWRFGTTHFITHSLYNVELENLIQQIRLPFAWMHRFFSCCVDIYRHTEFECSHQGALIVGTFYCFYGNFVINFFLWRYHVVICSKWYVFWRVYFLQFKVMQTESLLLDIARTMTSLDLFISRSSRAGLIPLLFEWF